MSVRTAHSVTVCLRRRNRHRLKIASKMSRPSTWTIGAVFGGMLGVVALVACDKASENWPNQKLEAGNGIDMVRVPIEQRVSRSGNLDGIKDGPVLQSGLKLGERSLDGTYYSASDYIVTIRGQRPVYAGTTVEATGKSKGSLHLTLEFSDVAKGRAGVSVRRDGALVE